MKMPLLDEVQQAVLDIYGGAGIDFLKLLNARLGRPATEEAPGSIGRPGSPLGIVLEGEQGSGKTTLSHLIQRAYALEPCPPPLGWRYTPGFSVDFLNRAGSVGYQVVVLEVLPGTGRPHWWARAYPLELKFSLPGWPEAIPPDGAWQRLQKYLYG